MAREHRILKDGKITVVPYTPAEEAKADQWEADQLARQAQEANPTFRVNRVFQATDKDRAFFNATFNHENRIRVLEGKQPITKAQLKDWFKSQLD